MSAATLTLKAVTEDCVAPACSVELVKVYHQILGKLFGVIENGLTYQYHSAWCHVLHLLAVWFQVKYFTLWQNSLPFCAIDTDQRVIYIILNRLILYNFQSTNICTIL
jgi:hypothetical protein